MELDLLDVSPAEIAATVARQHADDPAWLDEFSDALARERNANQARRVLSVWGLSHAEAGRLFGVSRQAVARWLHSGVPATQVEAFADLDAATDLLVHYVRRDRIPAVVRRSAGNLGDRSLIDLVGDGDTGGVLEACRNMFGFDRIGS